MIGSGIRQRLVDLINRTSMAPVTTAKAGANAPLSLPTFLAVART